VKAADDGWVVAVRDLDDASGALPGVGPPGARREQLDQYEVTLHGAVELGGRNKYIAVLISGGGAVACGANESEAVAVHVQAACDEVCAGLGCLRKAPVVAVGFDQGTARGEASKLFEEEPALAATAEAEFADKLLVAGAPSGGTGDAGEKIAVGGHVDLMVLRRVVGLDKGLWEYHLGARFGEKIVDEGCNFRGEVGNMQTKDSD
jgi:hypothetical protein